MERKEYLTGKVLTRGVRTQPLKLIHEDRGEFIGTYYTLNPDDEVEDDFGFVELFEGEMISYIWEEMYEKNVPNPEPIWA